MKKRLAACRNASDWVRQMEDPLLWLAFEIPTLVCEGNVYSLSKRRRLVQENGLRPKSSVCQEAEVIRFR